ncbi:hypothetical protein [Corynebacterium mastitidis]|uniref:hypothetical protein n=1 Tax=Corynebacterium mastitidis TaxID=161890 RepID=UPI0012EAD96D|nr:hypothetical protein [Corynebacterium mastitidis]
MTHRNPNERTPLSGKAKKSARSFFAHDEGSIFWAFEKFVTFSKEMIEEVNNMIADRQERQRRNRDGEE